MYQVNTYLRLGRAYGYSPEEYYDKVAGLGTNLDRTDLVFIKVRVVVCCEFTNYVLLSSSLELFSTETNVHNE